MSTQKASNKWKADSKLTVVMSAEQKETYIIVDGVHRYYALARHIERSEARGQGTFMHEFDIPAIILRSETPQAVLTADAAAVNYQGTAQVSMSYLDNCVAVRCAEAGVKHSLKHSCPNSGSRFVHGDKTMTPIMLRSLNTCINTCSLLSL